MAGVFLRVLVLYDTADGVYGGDGRAVVLPLAKGVSTNQKRFAIGANIL